MRDGAAQRKIDLADNSAQHQQIHTAITDVAVTLKVMANQKLQLDDHEARLRLVEQRQADVLARLGSLERHP
jgi:hypothetical protein